MKLPNVEAAVAPKAKVVDYLLSPTHPGGKSKAEFFSAFGFSREHWTDLRDALLTHAREHEIKTREVTDFGLRYTIDGNMLSPSGVRLRVRTVWFIDNGVRVPRFVTSHPLKRRNS